MGLFDLFKGRKSKHLARIAEVRALVIAGNLDEAALALAETGNKGLFMIEDGIAQNKKKHKRVLELLGKKQVDRVAVLDAISELEKDTVALIGAFDAMK